MEDHPDPPPPNPATTTVHPKHAAMLHRLSNTKQTKPSSTDTFESTQSFLTLFSDHKLSIDSSLSSASSLSDVAPISASISALEALVAESSYFLPPYELRTSLRTIQSLKQTLETLSSQIAPKKPFSFKNKAKPSIARKLETQTHMPQLPQSAFSVSESPRTMENEVLSKELNNGECVVSDLNKLKPSNLLKPVAETRMSELPGLVYLVPESPGFRNRENEVLSKVFLGSEMGEFVISDLDSCEVRLRGCFRALFAHKLKNCRIYSGPVSGSVLIEEVEDCIFVLASHQIRIHNAKTCDFYLRVRSRPIIEDCGGVRFAPYCLGYEGIEKDLGEVKLDEENGNWGNVDDFKWLKGFQSPNWSVLPESERIGQVTISESDK